MVKPVDFLRKHWGYIDFKEAQKKAVDHVLNNKDVIVLLPTGGGKSICFQIPALVMKGICIVISPLISLMQDQVKNLQDKGIKALMLAGKLNFKELERELDNCMYGNYKFLYLSPERLQNEYVQNRLQQMNVNLIAIDEAHCISEWGHDFRPAYRNISLLKDLHPEVPTIALTATATHTVLRDIRTNLKLENAALVRQSFERKNIFIQIKKTEDKNYHLQQFLKRNPGSGIVYVRSRNLTLNLKRFLNYHDITAEAFHGGMDSTERKQLLENWKEEKFKVIVATTAFGMGIDKANVRHVIHYQLPESIESYYQEIGRAGRDERAAKAFLVYDASDILQLKNQFLKNFPTREDAKLIYKRLNAYLSIARGEGQDKLYNFKFLDFCHRYDLNTLLTYNTLQFFENANILSLSKEFTQRTELYFKIPPNRLHVFLAEQQRYKALIHSLIRMQGGFFEHKTTIDLYQLERQSGINRKLINTLLRELEQKDIIDLVLADQDTTIEFLVPREDKYTVNPILKDLDLQYENKKLKIKKLITYITDNKECKTKQLLAYFDEIKTEDCRHCAVCSKKYAPQSKRGPKNIREFILQQLESQKLNSKQLLSFLEEEDESLLLLTLRQMVDENTIGHTVSGYFYTKKSESNER